jgi:hypothetical protein
MTVSDALGYSRRSSHPQYYAIEVLQMGMDSIIWTMLDENGTQLADVSMEWLWKWTKMEPGSERPRFVVISARF